VQSGVAKSVGSHQVVVECSKEHGNELSAAEHAREVQSVEAQLVSAETDTSASFKQRSCETDTPAFVGDQRATHESRSTVSGAVADVHIGAEFCKNLNL